MPGSERHLSSPLRQVRDSSAGTAFGGVRTLTRLYVREPGGKGGGGRRAEAHPCFSQTGGPSHSCSGRSAALPRPRAHGARPIRERSIRGQTLLKQTTCTASPEPSPFSGPLPVPSQSPGHSVHRHPAAGPPASLHSAAPGLLRRWGSSLHRRRDSPRRWGARREQLGLCPKLHPLDAPHAPRACSSDLS